MKSPILGQAYTARSLNAAANRLVNLYAEQVVDGGKEAAYFTRAPGRRLVKSIGNGPIRGLWAFGGKGYAVSGDKLYEIGVDWSLSNKGSVSGGDPVSMDDNGYQLFISANPDGYIYNQLTGAYAQILDADFPGSDMVTYIGGYFVYNEPGTQRFFVSSVLDGTGVDALDYASSEAYSDDIVAPIASHKELWMLGAVSTEIFYQSDTTDFPFQPIQAAFIEIGCAAKHSAKLLDNSVFWLGRDRRGFGIVYRSQGYNAVRISTHAIEFEIQSYHRIDDARAFTYQQDGHAFYVLNFPTAKKTWVYDVATQWWHERLGFYLGQDANHPATCFMNFNGELIVGDDDGNLCAYDLDYFTDNGATIRWVRSWRGIPTGQNNLKRTIWSSLQLDCETGVGLNGENAPNIALRVSDDGGHTWGNEHVWPMGKIGEFFTRVVWRRLGITLKRRDRVFEISGTDPVKVAILGAEVEVSGGAH